MMTIGVEKRQFLHGDDFAEAACVLMNSYKKYSGLTVDVSSFEWVSIREVADLVAELYGPGVQVIQGKAESNFQTCVNEPNRDIRKAGWKPKISLREGLRIE